MEIQEKKVFSPFWFLSPKNEIPATFVNTSDRKLIVDLVEFVEHQQTNLQSITIAPYESKTVVLKLDAHKNPEKTLMLSTSVDFGFPPNTMVNTAKINLSYIDSITFDFIHGFSQAPTLGTFGVTQAEINDWNSKYPPDVIVPFAYAVLRK